MQSQPESVIPLALKNKFINSVLISIHNILLEDYQQFKLSEYENFINYYSTKGKNINVNPMEHDFFEHSILHAANLLPLTEELRDKINLKFSRFSHIQANVCSDKKIMALSIGIPDKYLIETDGQYTPEYNKLCEIPEILVDSLDLLNEFYAMEIDEIRFMREFNFQYMFALNVECVVQTFIINPFFTAQYLINNYSKINSPSLIIEACQQLIIEINKFRNLKNGITCETIDTISIDLNNIILLNSVQKIQENEKYGKSKHSIFSYPMDPTVAFNKTESPIIMQDKNINQDLS